MNRWIAPAADGVQPAAGAPRFSVLIAAYNSAATVGAAIESALAQTAPPHEVIVCDDGSTDDIEGALRPFRDRIRLVRKDNGGGASALNAALREASGDFVISLDADDEYLPHRLAAVGELAASRPDLEIVGTDAFYEADGRRIGRFNAPPNVFPAEEQRRWILERCFLISPAVRRERLLATGGWDESFAIAYDWDCWMRLILGGARAGSVDEPLLLYRLHESSLSARRADSLRERIRLLEKNATGADLTPAERAWADEARARHARTALLAEAQDSVRHGRADARARLLAVGREPTFGRRARVRALLLAASPRPIRRRLLPVLGFGARSERRHATGPT